MLVHHGYYRSTFITGDLLDKAKKAIPRYQEFHPRRGLESWCLPSHPDLVLMEGRQIKAHNDGGKFWQPFIVLYNPDNKYSFRGPGQAVKNLEPQTASSLLVLDISKQHQVTGHSDSTWSVLCWNPGGRVPHKNNYSLEAVVEGATTAFGEFEKDT